jgi:hypothetical protein
MFGKFGIGAIAATLFIAVTASAKAPDTWDNLYKVKSKKVDVAYLLPDADFRTYTKVMLDPAEVAFDKNWQRDYNSNMANGSTTRKLTDSDVATMLDDARAGFGDEFTKAFTKGGYQIVTVPAADVLRVRAAVINVRINAPDTMTAGRTRSYSREAGQATLVLEVRDSLSNALLGRAVDGQTIGDNSMMMSRNSVTNRADFAQAFGQWAKIAVKSLDTLKSSSPISIPAK